MYIVTCEEYIKEAISKIRQKREGGGQFLQVLECLVKTLVFYPKGNRQPQKCLSSGLMWSDECFKGHPRCPAGSGWKSGKNESRETLKLRRWWLGLGWWSLHKNRLFQVQPEGEIHRTQ